MKGYQEGFYVHRHAKTLYAADAILSLVLEMIPPVGSAVDVGCGVGTWLSVLRMKGVAEITGVEGDWVNRALLEVPTEAFVQAELTRPLTLNRHYDLAICLEVAEHLPPENATGLVESLTGLADFVLFSAAIPGQAGNQHHNEQWPEYWAGLFGLKGYVAVDRIRNRIWHLSAIPSWYRQNVLLFVKSERLADVRLPEDASQVAFLSRVHPDLYLDKIREHSSVKGCWTLLCRAVRASTMRRLKSIFRN